MEFTAVYSPPIPAPVMARNTAKLAKFHDNAVARLASMYVVKVMKNNFLRPRRSVSQPK